MTRYLFRLVVICPAAKLAAVGAWWKANLDVNDDASTWPLLNPSGDPAQAATHSWCSVALKDSQARALLAKVCQLATVTPPTLGTWNGWTFAQKAAWLAGVRQQLFTNTGVWLDLCDNTGDWNDPTAALAQVAVKVRQAQVTP